MKKLTCNCGTVVKVSDTTMGQPTTGVVCHKCLNRAHYKACADAVQARDAANTAPEPSKAHSKAAKPVRKPLGTPISVTVYTKTDTQATGLVNGKQFTAVYKQCADLRMHWVSEGDLTKGEKIVIAKAVIKHK
jgi:hypothetical protein